CDCGLGIADCGFTAPRSRCARIRNSKSAIRNWGVSVPNQFDVIIIGGGPAGYVAAIRAAQLGLATALVEKEKLGGVCVNIGCIPTKALLHSAYIARLLREAKEFGIEAGVVKTDYGVAMQRSRRVSDQNSKGVEFLMKKNKVTVVKGTGVLQPGKKVKIGSDSYEARKAVIVATGSRVKGLPQIGLEINKTTVISSDEALFLEQAPASMAVVGAGAVGMEFADIFHAFGTKVTLIEVLPRILPLEDAEASDALTKSYKKRGIEVLAGAKVTKANVGKDRVALDVEANGAKQKVEAAVVLMAAGRAVNTDNVVGRFPFSANGRARGTGETEGFVKIIRDKKYGEILGAHIVGSPASELIHELAVARENEYTVEEVELAIHAHPTMSEAVAEAALDSLGRVLHI